MNKFYFKLSVFIFSIMVCAGLRAQVTVTGNTNTTPAMAANYTTLTNAITALNTITAIIGPVTITVAAGNTQGAPAGGYLINFTAVTTAARNVVITGNNNIVLASNAQVAGSLTDAIFKIVGCDFITIENFLMRENPSNNITAPATNNMTEWGVALLRASVTNGAQNNVIRNNTIQLNRTYSNSFGIYSNTRHTAIAPTVLSDISSTAGANSNNDIYGNSISNVNQGIAFIGSGVATTMDLANDIGGTSSLTGNTITNWGGLSAASSFVSNATGCYAIFINNQKSERAAFNTITSASLSGPSVSVRGIYKSYTIDPTGTFISIINSNVITINHNFTSGILEAVLSEGISAPLSTATISIINNRFQNIAVLAASSSTNLVGISNTSSCGILNINSNIFRENTSTATTGGFTAISNTGAVQTTVIINSNKVGDATGNAISFSAATNAELTGISCAVIADAASLTISSNNFQGFVQTVAGTAGSAHNYISFVHSPTAAVTDNINSNTFTNLTANTAGDVTFIERSGIMALSAGATENCNNNSIVTAFSKPLAGSVGLYKAISGSLAGNTMVQTGNNFSNISAPLSTVDGWHNAEGGVSGPTKTIDNNVFSNWTVGTDSRIIFSDKGGDNTSISGNMISGISGTGDLSAIYINGANKGNNQTCSNNTIEMLSSSGNTVSLLLAGICAPGDNFVSNFTYSNNIIHGLSCTSSGGGFSDGMFIFSSPTVNIFNNRIYDIISNSAAVLVRGISIQTTAASRTFNIYNNCIGNLRADIGNDPKVINGININSTAAAGTAFNIYYNSIYLNASSTGTNFGTSGILLTPSTTATNASASLRNNIIVNTSSANGTGLSAAYTRTGTALNNFATSSNNNIFYAGTPSATHVIFTDGTNNDQTLAAYKARVGPTRDAASFTEMPPFLSTVGSSADFLHIDPAAATQAESGAVNIATYTTDFDGNIRQGNPGYVGAGTAPDIGADEIANETNPPVISYTTISSPICIFSGMTISGVTITDATGIPLSGALIPRIYFRKNAGAWFSEPGTNTGGTAKNSTWSFTINEASMGGVVTGDVVAYFIIAQDNMPTPSVRSNPGAGLVAGNVNTVTTAPTTPNTYTLIGSLNGLYTVGVGGNFTTINAAFNAYNSACSLAGPVIFELTDDTYPLDNDLQTGIVFHPDASPVKTLTIRPSATATPVISISTTFFASSYSFAFYGAKYVTIDGRQGGTGATKSLTITNPGGGVTIGFVENAQNNTIKYCIIKGRCSSTAAGTILFDNAAATGTGNDNNTIDNNDITDPGNGFFSTYGIYSVATSTRGNDNMLIANNNISNYYNATTSSAGIYLPSTNSPNYYSRDWTITGNRLFQTATRLYTAAADHYGIRITGGAGFTISNNVIGFANATGTGKTNMIGNSSLIAGFPTAYSPAGISRAIRYRGIFITAGYLLPVSNIDGNIIGGIAMYTSSNSNTLGGIFSGIYQNWDGTANIGMNTGNTIGSSTQTNSIYIVSTTSGGMVTGIYAYYFYVAPLVYVQKNMIGGILVSGASNTVGVGITGIESNAYAIEANVSENFIGNSIPGNLRTGYAVDGGGLLSINGTLQACTGGGIAITGIIANGFGSVDDNTLQGWATSNTGGAVVGIQTSIASATNNKLGTAVLDWINYPFANSGALTGIDVVITVYAASVPLNISNNKFRSVAYAVGATNTGACNFIQLTGSTASGRAANITGNEFINLSLKASSINLINTSNKMSASGRRTIENNKITGTLSVTAANGNLTMIRCEGDPAAGSIVAIRNNDFSNVTINVLAGSYCTGIIALETNAANDGHSTKKITGNILANWSGNNTYINGMWLSNFGSVAGSISSVDSVANNTISSLLTGNGGITGIVTGYTSSADNLADTIRIVDNAIFDIASASSVPFYGSSGISITFSSAGHKFYVNRNTIHGISVVGPSGMAIGMVASEGNQRVEINSNKVYDISATDAGAFATGIGVGFDDQLGTVLGDDNNTISLYNNLVGDIKTPAAGVAVKPSVKGIDIVAGSNISVMHNTVHLDATSTNPLFSTAAVYTHTNSFSSNNILTHNLFNNLSIPGSSGKTVAHWRETNSFTNLANSTDYNSYYAGTPAANRLLYFDGSNSIQTLANYKTALLPRESGALNEVPLFLSTAGASADYLHLNPLGNCGLIQKVLSGSVIPSDFDGDMRFTFPFYTDIGADEVSKRNVWTGTNGTAWGNALNWSLGTVPDGLNRRVFIPLTANQPVIATGETFQVSDIIINAGAILSNRGALKIGGLYIGGSADAINNVNAGVVTGSIEINGLCNPKLFNGNIFAGNAVKDFKVGTDVTISGVAAEHVKISGELGFASVSSKTFNTNNNVVLVSTADATANVGVINNGNTITGQLTVERFIPARRSWRLLTAPLTSGATTTISQAWQDGQQATTIPPPAYTPGSGSLITFSTTAVNGYDKGSTNNPSLKFFNGTAWVAPANTTMPIKTHPGYMLFVRGDRNISIAGSGVAANTTTLRPKGPVNIGVQTITAAGAGFKIIGNPYASAINFHTTIKSGLADSYRLWDPKIGGLLGVGGFVTFAWNNINGNYDRTVTGAGSSLLPQDGTIQSGAAFVVNFTGAGSLQINETDKLTTSAAAPFGRPAQPPQAEGRLNASLGFADSDGSMALLDGVLVTWHNSYKNEVDGNDAVKLTNVNEDFGISGGGKIIAIERRKSISKNDTIFFAFTQPKLRTYILQLAPMHLARRGLTAFIEDKYTNTKTPVSLTDSSNYSFTVTSTAGSYASDRLRLVFKTSSLECDFINLQAVQQHDQILLNWKVGGEDFVEKYEIEKSTNGIDFSKVTSITSDGNNLYKWLDEQAAQGNNFYRIKKIGYNGEFEYSNVVSARIGKTTEWIHVYPNPVTVHFFYLQMKNAVSVNYTLRLVNTLGQQVYTTPVYHSGGESVRKIELPDGISAGQYQLELTNSSGQSYIASLLIK